MNGFTELQVHEIWASCRRPPLQDCVRIPAMKVFFHDNPQPVTLPVIESIRPKETTAQPPPSTQPADNGRVTVQQARMPRLQFAPPGVETTTKQNLPRPRVNKKESDRQHKAESKEQKRYTIFFLVDIINRAAENYSDSVHVVLTFKHKKSWGKGIPLPFTLRIEYEGRNCKIRDIIRNLRLKATAIEEVVNRMSFYCNILYELAPLFGIVLTLGPHSGRTTRDPDLSSRQLIKCEWNGKVYTKEDIIAQGKLVYETAITQLGLPKI